MTKDAELLVQAVIEVSKSINGPNYYAIVTTIMVGFLTTIVSVISVLKSSTKTIKYQTELIKLSIVASVRSEIIYINELANNIIDENPGSILVPGNELISIRDNGKIIIGVSQYIGMLEEDKTRSIVCFYSKLATIKSVRRDRSEGDFINSMIHMADVVKLRDLGVAALAAMC